MSNASIDENGVRSLLGILDTNGSTITPIKANPIRHSLLVSNGTAGTDIGPTNAGRDENDQPTLMGVSNADGITPVVIYSNSSGKLLVNKN